MLKDLVKTQKTIDQEIFKITRKLAPLKQNIKK